MLVLLGVTCHLVCLSSSSHLSFLALFCWLSLPLSYGETISFATRNKMSIFWTLSTLFSFYWTTRIPSETSLLTTTETCFSWLVPGLVFSLSDQSISQSTNLYLRYHFIENALPVSRLLNKIFRETTLMLRRSAKTWDGITLSKDALNSSQSISVFKSLNNLYPESLKSMFKPTSGVYSYNVRGASNNVFVPRIRTEAAKRTFSYWGTVMWNGLENVLKDEKNPNSFKSALSLPWTMGLPWGGWDRTYF